MASKSSSPGPNPTTTSTTKQGRSRKAAIPNAVTQGVSGRAGSAGGIVLEKEQTGKSSTVPTTKSSSDHLSQNEASETTSTPKTRRKPRKLNKEPTSTPAQTAPTASAPNIATTEASAAAELEALKSRVRELEAKVEQLYSAAEARSGRSPRRRGKGKKNSSTTQLPTVSTPAAKVTDVGEQDGDEEVDEELVRLEGELEVARQDLEAYRPQRRRRTTSQETTTDDIEEIPREGLGSEEVLTGNRHVTLSGSYRIPLPSSVSMDDVRTIQSGVSAAQNVARSFLEQRRAAAAVREAQSPATSGGSPGTRATGTRGSRAAKPASTRAMSSSMEVEVARDAQGGKQSWSEWIGGYSMAITRAVNKIEHEAAVESHRAGTVTSNATKRAPGNPAAKKAAGKRPAAKAKLSGEQVHGLMS